MENAACHFLDCRHVSETVGAAASGIVAAVRVVGIFRSDIAAFRIELWIGLIPAGLAEETLVVAVFVEDTQFVTRGPYGGHVGAVRNARNACSAFFERGNGGCIDTRQRFVIEDLLVGAGTAGNKNHCC